MKCCLKRKNDYVHVFMSGIIFIIHFSFSFVIPKFDGPLLHIHRYTVKTV